jgi:hypothetical protein
VVAGRWFRRQGILWRSLSFVPVLFLFCFITFDPTLTRHPFHVTNTGAKYASIANLIVYFYFITLVIDLSLGQALLIIDQF